MSKQNSLEEQQNVGVLPPGVIKSPEDSVFEQDSKELVFIPLYSLIQANFQSYGDSLHKGVKNKEEKKSELCISGQKIKRGQQSIIETLPEVYKKIEEDIKVNSPPRDLKSYYPSSHKASAALSRPDTEFNHDHRPLLEIRSLAKSKKGL